MSSWIVAVGLGLLSVAETQESPQNETAAEVVIPQALGQPADDDVTRLDAVVPRTQADQKRVDAISHFMTGQVHQTRREMAEALESYGKAIELDPTAYEVAAAYVPLAYVSGRTSDAEDRALDAAVQMDRGYILARQLAGLMATSRRPGSAVRLLEKLLVVPRVKDRLLAELLVRRELGAIEQARGSAADAAEQYRVVFAALEESGKLTKAERTEILGDASATYDAFGEAFLAIEDADLAVRAFDRAAEARPGKPAVHAFNLATVFRKTREPEKALAELEKYLSAQLQSKGVDAYVLLEELLTELNREADLLPRLSALVEADKRNSTLRFFYADKLLEADDLDEAKTQYETALGGGRDLRGLTGLIEIARRRGDADALFEHIVDAFPLIARSGDAGDVFQTRWNALKEDEETLDKVIAVGQRRIEDESEPLQLLPTYIFGKLLLEAGRVRDAFPFFRYAIELRDVSRYTMAQEVSTPLFENRMFGEAADLWKLAVEDTSPGAERTLPQAYIFLARSSALAGREKDAEQAIKMAQSLRPDDLFVDYQAAVVFTSLKRLAEAATRFERLIERLEEEDDDRMNSLIEDSQFQLSNIYTQMGQVDRGADVLLKILEDDPANTQANNDLGYLWADAGINLDRAEKMIRRALKDEPDNAAYLDSLGWVLYRKGDLEGARKYLEEATAKPRGNDAVLHEHLGDVLRDQGDAEAAQRAYDKALELESEAGVPDEELVKRVRGKLDGKTDDAE